MMQKRDPESDPRVRLQPIHAGMLMDVGFNLSRHHRILDFGCGSGRSVLEYRRAGYEAYGTDIEDQYSAAVDAVEERWFALAETSPTFHIPFPDGFFDFVYSAVVFEHVRDYDSALAEISRVTNAEGLSLHWFPSRYRPIEPHIFVPLAGVFRKRKYLDVWARLGVRNQFQVGMNHEMVATLNEQFLSGETNYLPRAQILRHARKHFAEAEFIEDIYVRHWPGATRHLRGLVRLAPFLKVVIGAFHSRVILLRHPIAPAPNQ